MEQSALCAALKTVSWFLVHVNLWAVTSFVLFFFQYFFYFCFSYIFNSCYCSYNIFHIFILNPSVGCQLLINHITPFLTSPISQYPNIYHPLPSSLIFPYPSPSSPNLTQPIPSFTNLSQHLLTRQNLTQRHTTSPNITKR